MMNLYRRISIHLQVFSACRFLWHESEVWTGGGGGSLPPCGGDMWRALSGRADWTGVHLHPLAETDGQKEGRGGGRHEEEHAI